MSVVRNVVSLGALAVSLLTASGANAGCVCRYTNGQNVSLCRTSSEVGQCLLKTM